MKKILNKKWFSIVIAIWLIAIVSLSALLILEYMIPFSKNIKWIENSSKAYYLANSWIENSLFFINRNQIWQETHTNFPSSATWTSIHLVASWSLLPPPWKWNSRFHNDWNKISPNFPIQLNIWSNSINEWSNVSFYFRVPNLNNENWNDERLEWNLPIINWQLSSISNTINSSWSLIEPSSINWNQIDFSLKQWALLDGTLTNFSSFYNDNSYWCKSGNPKKCILKLSIINKINSNIDWVSVQVPHLEWKIDFWLDNIPLRYALINSQGKSYWFKKTIKISVAQQTVIEAFDFTVFQ